MLNFTLPIFIKEGSIKLTKKILLYSGSRNLSSRTNIIIEQIHSYIVGNYADIQTTKIDPLSMPLRHSTGCKNCFEHGTCPSEGYADDNGKFLKEKADEADLIIFATPVYSHNVSSDSKIFIDRLSYWGHLMKFAGKSVITIVTCESNGGEHVDSYLKKVFTFMGANILHSEIFFKNYDEDEYREGLEEIESVIHDHYKNDFPVVISDKHESTFQTMKSILNKYPKEHFEYRYWEESGMFKSPTLKEHIKSKSSEGLKC